jgi:hypothetical protein
MDPRADWLLGPGLDDYLPDPKTTLIPFIISLHDKKGLDVVRGLLRSPPFYISSWHAKKMKIGGHFPGFAPLEFFQELVKKDGAYAELRDVPKQIKLCVPLPASQPKWKPGDPAPVLDPTPLTPPDGGWPDDTVVIGVIDDGIAFAHDRFRDAAGTSRVQCFWRQDGPNNSTTVEYGTELCKPDGPGGRKGIDTLLAESTFGNAVDEETFYRRAGLIDFAETGHKTAAWSASHGTHVLDIAAGESPADDVGNRPIVCVQLDPAIVEDTALGGLEDKLLNAIDYILARADDMADGGDPLPVVINFSFGNIAGPHDGTSSLERGIEERLADHPDRLRVVLPSGNSHLSRCHAEFAFTKKDEVVELPWRVQPDDTTASSMEIWLPHEGPDVPDAARMRLSVRAPDGTETALLGETHSTGVHILNNGEVVCAAQYLFMPFPTERGLFAITLQPTVRLFPTETPALRDKIAPSGVWTVRLHNVSLENADTVQAWIQRDDRVFSYPRRGRQSYFDEPCYVRFDSKGREIEDDSDPEQPACVVRRRSLINAIATGDRAIVAGAFLRNDLRPARYSAGGPITPTRDGMLDANFRKPDAMLVGDDSKVHAGILAAGSRSGSVVNFSGTSVAAPQLARWIATELGAARAGDRNAVKAEAQAQEAGHPVSTPLLPAERGGWGRIERPPVVPLPRSLKVLA